MAETTDIKSAESRYAAIVALVRQRGFVPIGQLAEQLGVTVQTIRRDVAQLSDAGKVSRFHGGVGLPSSVENIDYSTRKVLKLNEKKRIARRVASRGASRRLAQPICRLDRPGFQVGRPSSPRHR